MSGYWVHQISGAAWAADHSGMLWWDVRRGKTRGALLAGRQLLEEKRIDRIIAIAPKTARGVWLSEWVETGGDEARVCRLYGKTNQRARGTLSTAQLVIVSWDVLGAWAPFLRYGKYALIADESHVHATGPQARRWKALHYLGAFAQTTWLLSGTPYRTSAMDIYYQLMALPNFSMGESQFGNQFCYKRPNAYDPRGFSWDGLRNEEELIALAPIHRVRDKDAAAPKRSVMVLDEGDRHLHYDVHDATSLAHARTALIKVKAERVVEVLRETLTERPIVVFGWHTEFLRTVAAATGGTVLDGTTSEGTRQRAMDSFQRGEIGVLAMQMRLAMGIPLTRAKTAIFGELDWNEDTHRQSEGRLKGVGLQPTYNYVVVRDSVDDYIWDVRLGKGRAMDRLDSAIKEAV